LNQAFQIFFRAHQFYVVLATAQIYFSFRNSTPCINYLLLYMALYIACST